MLENEGEEKLGLDADLKHPSLVGKKKKERETALWEVSSEDALRASVDDYPSRDGQK